MNKAQIRKIIFLCIKARIASGLMHGSLLADKHEQTDTTSALKK